MLVSYGAFGALTIWLYTLVPRGFLPEEDQGYFIVNVQAPSGSSLEYTERAVSTAQRTLRTIPEVRNIFAIGGFSFLGSGPNRALMFVTLHPWEEREGKER
jgi:HAE1 family hydrophobic/amphiphilic exporter-1